MPSNKKTLQILLQVRDEASKAMNRFGNTMKGTAKVSAAAFASVAAGLGVVIKATAEYERHLGNLQTLYGADTESVKKFNRGIKELLRTVPKSANDLGASAYSIVSAGITDTSEAIEALEGSAKLAVAGLGETSEAVDIVTSAMNAFSTQNVSGAQAAEVFFSAVKNGKTTVSELAQGFGQVAPLANQMNINFEELLASVSAMTTTGLKASVAYTQVRATLSNLLKPTEEMKNAFDILGISQEDLIAQLNADDSGVGFIQTLTNLKEVANQNGLSLANMFGSVEALNAVLMLTGATGETANQILGTMTDTVSELDQAFQSQNQTFHTQVQLLKNAWSTTMINIGEHILPHTKEAVHVLTEALNDFSFVIVNHKQILDDLKRRMAEFIMRIEEETGLVSAMTHAWQTVSMEFRENVMPAVMDLWEAFQPYIPGLKILAQILGKTLMVALVTVLKLIETGLIVALRAMELVLKSVTALLNTFRGAWELATKVWEKALNVVNKLIAALKRLNELKSSAANAIGFGGARAAGGPVQRGKTYLVGENGPEMFTPDGNGAIIPNHKLKGGSSMQYSKPQANGVVINLNIPANTYVGSGGVREFAREISNVIMDELRMQQRLSIT